MGSHEPKASRVTWEVQIRHGKGQFRWMGAPNVNYRHFLPSAVQKRLNRSIYRLGYELEWAEGCTNSIVFARWRQCALIGGHVDITCQITFNHSSTAAMRLMSNYFDHLSSLNTPTTYTVAHIAKHFEPSTVLWAFHTIQPTSFKHTVCYVSFSPITLVSPP